MCYLSMFLDASEQKSNEIDHCTLCLSYSDSSRPLGWGPGKKNSRQKKTPYVPCSEVRRLFSVLLFLVQSEKRHSQMAKLQSDTLCSTSALKNCAVYTTLSAVAHFRTLSKWRMGRFLARPKWKRLWLLVILGSSLQTFAVDYIENEVNGPHRRQNLLAFTICACLSHDH